MITLMKILMYRVAFLTLITCWLIFSTAAAQAQQSNPTATVPSYTDPRISSFNNPHYSWLPTDRPCGQLLVFLQGTFGVPRPHFPFLETAATLGYHVIELAYPDDVAAQQACIKSPDPDAYIKFRLEIIQGGNLSDLIHVDPADSIENRLQQLLRYLVVHQANCGWNQFLDSYGKIDWGKICVSGQSQGGGHAYIIAKYHAVARVIMTGSPKDFSHYFRAPARGFDSSTRTPLDRMFAFNHAEDTMGACNHAQQMEILQQMGLTQYGIADADHPAANYNHARIIVTDVQLENMNDPKLLHNVPLNGNIPVCPPVWRYMLTEPVR